MRKGGKVQGMLRGCYGLGEMKTKRVPTTWIHLGVIGAGTVLGLATYPYASQPLGMVLMGAAGSIVAVGLLLLAYDTFKTKHIVTVP